MEKYGGYYFFHHLRKSCNQLSGVCLIIMTGKDEMWHNPEYALTITPNMESDIPKPASGKETEIDKNHGDVSEVESLHDQIEIGLISVQAPCQIDVNGAPGITFTSANSQPKDPVLEAASDWPGD